MTPENRVHIIELVAAKGYSGRELATLMAVSPAAVSRYLHHKLYPSMVSLCRLIDNVDEATVREIVEYIAHTLIEQTIKLLQELAQTDKELAYKLIEELADKIAEMIEEYSSL